MRPHESIDRVALTIGCCDRSGDFFSSVDDQAAAIDISENVVLRVVDVRVGWTADAALDVRRMMCDDEQSTTRCDGSGSGCEHRCPQVCGHLQISDHDEIESPFWRFPRRQIGDLGGEAFRVVPEPLGRDGSSAFEADRREIDRVRPPAAFGQPQRVATLAGGKIDRTPGWQVRAHLLDERVRAC